MCACDEKSGIMKTKKIDRTGSAGTTEPLHADAGAGESALAEIRKEK